MKEKNLLILVFAVVLIGLLLVVGLNLFSQNDVSDNQTEINLSLNNTTNSDNVSYTKTTAKKSTESKSKANSDEDDDIYYDEELNEYFDKNDRTVYEGQSPKGTSKSEIIESLNEIGDS